MKKPRLRATSWAKTLQRSFAAMARLAQAGSRQASKKTLARALQPKPASTRPRRSTPLAGTWLPGLVMGAGRALRYRLFRPAGIKPGERVPLLVMLHGCTQDAEGFAASTRMNRLAQRERCLVLYPEQDRLANAQGCWNWFNTDNGQAAAEVALVMRAIDQALTLYPLDRSRVAVAGLSAGASLAAQLVCQHPERFCALVMHSGVPPGAAHSAMSALAAIQGRRAATPLTASATTMAAHWPALLVIQGQADAVVAPANGVAAVQLWAQAAGAHASPPRRLQRGQRYPMVVSEHKRLGRSVATLVAVERLAHAWSGGAAGQAFSDPKGPDASRLLWAFVARQFRGAVAAR